MPITTDITCPWCGENPSAFESCGESVIYCFNEKCPVRPEVRNYVPLAELKNRWSSWEKLPGVTNPKLLTLRARINGKLSSRKITSEQQKAMQNGRKKAKLERE